MSPTPQGVLSVAVVLPCSGTIAVFLRFYVRRRMKKTELKGDDWTIFVALILTWILAILLIVGYAIGSFGGHTTINPATGADLVTIKEQNASKLHFSSYLVMALDFGLIKLSVLLLYRWIFLGRLFNIYSLIMCILICLWSLAFFFATAFQCGARISAWWTSVSTIDRYCDKTATLELAFGITDVMTDVMVLVIPLPIVWKLHMSDAQKAGLSGIFLLGWLSTAAGVTRLVIVVINIYDTTTGYRDLKAVLTNVVVWSQVEAGVAIVAACLPVFKPLFHGRSPESLLGSIRSIFSLHSLRHSQNSIRRESDREALAKGDDGMNLDSMQPSLETPITGGCGQPSDTPADGDIMQNKWGFTGEQV